MKVAIALFVKNEQQDIASWIAWHIALGVNKFFIFDDHSTDGTYEILQATARIHNIELHQTQPNEFTFFFDRQKEAYFHACRMATEQGYDWIGFFDGDEYVSLEHDQTIQDFLAKFSDFNAVALNWKIYGSSKRAFKSKLATYESFNYHCNINFNPCVLIKSFIRPHQYTYTYTDPHQFRMEDEKYADALGNTFEWTGNATKDVLWKGAHINHYICRSMEHYLQRVKRRVNTDIPNSTDNWQTYDKNDIFSPEKSDLIVKANLIVNNIKKECVQQFIQKNTENIHSFPNNYSAVKIVSFETFHKTIPGLQSDETFLAVYNKEDIFLKIFGVVYMNNPSIIYLFYLKNNEISNIPFFIRDEQNIASSYVYSLEAVDDSDNFSFKSLKTNKYATFLPNLYEHISVNRSQNDVWEQISLQEETIDINFCCCPEIINSKEMFIAYLQKYRDKITYADFILAFNQLDATQKQIITSSYPNGQLLNWI